MPRRRAEPIDRPAEAAFAQRVEVGARAEGEVDELAEREGLAHTTAQHAP